MSENLREFAAKLVALPFTESYVVRVNARWVRVEVPDGNAWTYNFVGSGKLLEVSSEDGEITTATRTVDEVLDGWAEALGVEPKVVVSATPTLTRYRVDVNGRLVEHGLVEDNGWVKLCERLAEKYGKDALAVINWL